MPPPVQVIVVGAGNRGENYSDYAKIFPDRMQVVGVADPREFVRKKLQARHKIPDQNTFKDWRCVVEREKFADAVLICTPDRLHKDPAVALAKKGYHILLEKPMAVGFYHFAHSFVRGNWRNEAESSFALLAKSCHDLDLIHHWAGGRRCIKVSSFGSLSHFTKENKPKEAANRCLDCPVEGDCAYSAKKIYLDRVKKGELTCDGHEITVFDFLGNKTTKHTSDGTVPGNFAKGGHGCADFHLIDSFISAVTNGDPTMIRSGPMETLVSHKLVFQAERARLENRVVFCENPCDGESR